MPDSQRRRLLTALALSPLLCSLPLSAVAERGSAVDLTRIVALEWLPTELLLTLGVAPLGVAEIGNYRAWVVEPAIPASSIDVGLRTEPNMELLTALKPSLLLCSQGYGPAASMLDAVAPSMAFPFNDGRDKPFSTARDSLLKLAQRLGRMPQARQHLAELDRLLAETRIRLAATATRPLLLMSLLDERHTLVFGQRSLFLEIMQLLGIASAWQGETNFWGSAVVGIERLAAIGDVDVVCFSHDDDEAMVRLSRTPLWQSMSFIRAGRFCRVPGIWFYGGTLSAMRFCRLLTQALEGMETV